MNLNKLESKLDDALSKETTESLTNWLNNKRMEKNVTINQGWECPKCGSVYSPYTAKCSVCPQGTISSSSTNITTAQGFHNFAGDGTYCLLCGVSKQSHPIISNT